MGRPDAEIHYDGEAGGLSACCRRLVRDTLLSRRARERGLMSPANLERFLSRPEDPLWFDVIWKALCIETWATIFLDGAVESPAPRTSAPWQVSAAAAP